MQSYKKIITELYGEYFHKSFKRLDRLSQQRSRLINNLTFLKRCRDNEVVPKGLRMFNCFHTKHAGKILKKAELALLRERIAWTRKQLSGVDDNIATLTEELWLTFEEEHFAVAKRMIDASFTRTFNKARSTQIAKYTRLTSERSKDKRRQEDLAVDTLRRTVVNQSARKLMPVEEEVLALGLNFAVVPHKIPKEEIVQHLEPKLNHLRDDIASNIRVKVTEVLRRTTLPKSNLSKEQKDAVRNLRADKSIHILKADKGNATVLLNRAEYESKIHALLETPTYKELKRDPTANIERKVCSKLSELRKSGILSQNLHDYLRPSCSVCPKFYGLPKIHKSGVPLRPIVASQGSPTYNLAKYLARILKPVVGQTEHHVVNSKEFVTNMQDVRLGKNEILVSFDVVSIY
ncbi:uncharacterized protein LOC114518725 [Dendronephthya gigantea]|uniref:uncharacterized protein LOC114518725 n=1 Tax=Dendronephthya gigantea TaxID=151771 RepID=UPI00106D16F9|nr:uncharacterized protein LOC114518725 [Dendronephthya gigantea]